MLRLSHRLVLTYRSPQAEGLVHDLAAVDTVVALDKVIDDLEQPLGQRIEEGLTAAVVRAVRRAIGEVVAES